MKLNILVELQNSIYSDLTTPDRCSLIWIYTVALYRLFLPNRISTYFNDKDRKQQIIQQI